MNYGAIIDTAFSRQRLIGMDALGIYQNPFFCVKNNGLSIYMELQFSFDNIEILQIFVPVIRDKIMLIG